MTAEIDAASSITVTTLLESESQPRFVNPLPVPEVIDASRPAGYVLQMRQNGQWLGLVDASGALGRQGIEFTDNDENGVPDDTNGDGSISAGSEVISDVRLTDLRPLAPEDQGAQDTQWVAPGEVLRIEALFDKPGVWHCHILSHEDHEMMRPFEVIGPEPTMLAQLPPLDAAQLLV